MPIIIQPKITGVKQNKSHAADSFIRGFPPPLVHYWENAIEPLLESGGPEHEPGMEVYSPRKHTVSKPNAHKHTYEQAYALPDAASAPRNASDSLTQQSPSYI